MKKRENNILLIALAVLVGLNMFLFFKISDMNSTLESLQYEVSSMNNRLDNSISNISHSVSEAIKKENSLINNFKYEYGEMKNGVVDLNLTVSPKEISSGSDYFFSYNLDGNEKSVVAEINSSSEISADIKIPINQALDVNFIIQDGDIKKIENLNYIYAFEERLIEPFSFNHVGEGITYHYSNNTVELNKVSYSLTYSQHKYGKDDSGDKSLENVSLYVEVNGNVIDTFPMEKSGDPFPSYLDDYRFTFAEYSVELKPKEKLDIYALASHSDGYKVKIILDSFTLDKDGEPDHNVDFEGNGKSIIY